jgi:hypothetical protein
MGSRGPKGETMQLTVSEDEYVHRLAGHLRSVGFEVVEEGELELRVLGLDDDVSSATSELEPFLRFWTRLYPDVGVEVALSS